MKIGIDGTPLTIPFPCGTKHYAEQLLTNLAEIDKNNSYFIFSSQEVPIPEEKNFTFVRTGSNSPVLKRQLFFVRAALKKEVDIFHYLEPFGAVFFRHPKIITTIHDLDLSFTYPFFSKYIFNRIYCEITRSTVIRQSNAFIAVSSSMKSELEKYLNKLEKRAPIFTIPNGVSGQFGRINSSNFKQDRYFLAMGDFTPRKNITKIIKSYSSLPKNTKRTHKLYIIASTYEAKENFIRKAQSLDVSAHTQVFHNVSLKKLTHLYNNATAFIYPSLYEGFGIPIIEAMACGCPVITSKHGATQETADGAAFLVNPKSVEEISNAMLKIANNPKLANILIRKGIKRAKYFSWKETAKKTLRVYEKTFDEK